MHCFLRSLNPSPDTEKKPQRNEKVDVDIFGAAESESVVSLTMRSYKDQSDEILKNSEAQLGYIWMSETNRPTPDLDPPGQKNTKSECSKVSIPNKDHSFACGEIELFCVPVNKSSFINKMNIAIAMHNASRLVRGHGRVAIPIKDQQWDNVTHKE